MKKIILIALVLLLVGIGAAYYSNREQLSEENIVLYGNVDIREVELGFRVAGRLEEMYMEEGDPVKAGDLLARIDDQPYLQEQSAARARVGRTEARLQLVQTGSRPQEIQAARARVAEAEAVHSNLTKDLQRQKELFNTKATSKKTLDLAQSRFDESHARLQSARESLALTEEGFRQEEITIASQENKEAEAQYNLASTRVADTQLLSPSDGVIITRVREPGAILPAGSPAYSLSLTDSVFIRAYISETELGKIAPGTAVKVSTDSSSRVYTGTVGFISPRAEFTPKNVETPDLRTDLVYRLRIIVGDSDEGLRQGMPVTVAIADKE